MTGSYLFGAYRPAGVSDFTGEGGAAAGLLDGVATAPADDEGAVAGGEGAEAADEELLEELEGGVGVGGQERAVADEDDVSDPLAASGTVQFDVEAVLGS